MAEPAILKPTVLRGVVEKFTAPETLLGLNRLTKEPWPYPSAEWDVIKGSKNIAKPNVPNSEAHIVPRLGISRESASFIYLREKKVFEPTTIHWIRTPGTQATLNAERAVLREVRDLDIRFNNFAEYCIWQAMTGTLSVDYPEENGGMTVSVDYKFPATHVTAPSVDWSAGATTAEEIVSDVNAWKRLIQRDSRVPAREVFLTEKTLEIIFTKFATVTTTASYISDRQRDSYITSGKIPGLLGLDWIPYESIYANASGDDTLFIPDNTIIMANLSDNRPMYVLEGPTADDEAPDGFTGKFSKTWKEPDPSSRQYLLEWHFLPIIERPEQFVYVADVTTP